MIRRTLSTILAAVAALAALAVAPPAGAAGESLGFNNARQLVSTGATTYALVWSDGSRVVLGEGRFGSPSLDSRTAVVTGTRVSQPAIARRGDTVAVAWVEGGSIRVRVREAGRWLPARTLGEGAAPALGSARDAFGLVWHGDGGGRSAVLFSRLGSSGAWTSPRALASARAGETVSFASIAGSGERLVAAWKRGGSAGWEVLIARSSDGGRHWSRPARVGEGADPAVCLAGQGETWIAYQSAGRIAVARSSDGGRTFARADVGEGWFGHVSCTRGAATLAWERTAYPPRHPDPRVKSFGLARVDSSLRVTSEAGPADENVVAPTVLAAGEHRAYAWIDVAGSPSPLAGELHVVSLR